MSKFVIFYGKNGAGKTNILEALSLFSSGKGLRKAALNDFVNSNTKLNTWNLELILEQDSYPTMLETGYINDRRFGKIDSSSISSLTALEKLIWLLWITPGMDTLFIGSKTERRNFFDHLVSGYERKYKGSLRRIQELQRERLSVLTLRRDETWLDILEEKLAKESVFVVRTRFEFIEQLNKVYKNYNSKFLRPNVAIEGKIEKIVELNNEENAMLEIADVLKDNRNDDKEKQITGTSVNRSSWFAYHPKSNREAENCSTGEQKAFLISLVLGVVRIYQQSRKGVPVLLLDDLMMHLDVNRRKSLVEEIVSLDVQTFFTGTELYLFEDMKDIAQIFHIENSICSEVAN